MMNPKLTLRSSAALHQYVTSRLNDEAYAQRAAALPLEDYLAALWHVVQAYQDRLNLTYELMATWLLEALYYPPVPHNWSADLRRDFQYQAETLAAANTLAYFAEIKTYAFFARRIRRQIMELKRMRAGLSLPAFVRWENQTVEGFLERGTYSEDDDPDDDLTWGDLSAIIGQGQWNE